MSRRTRALVLSNLRTDKFVFLVRKNRCTPIPSATRLIDNVIEESGKTYGHHG